MAAAATAGGMPAIDIGTDADLTSTHQLLARLPAGGHVSWRCVTVIRVAPSASSVSI